MKDITHKSSTLRKATASAVVSVSESSTITAIKEGTVPKGDVLTVARTAGLMGVKRTSDNIPDCHPIPVEDITIDFSINPAFRTITITVSAATLYRTGIEVEVMHGASITSVTLYDLLKPIDDSVTIESIELLNKTGGSGSFHDAPARSLTATVIVASDSIAQGKKHDKAGKAVIDKLKSCDIDVVQYKVLPDEKDQIQSLGQERAEQGDDIVIVTGGTGLSPRDVTPEALSPLIDTPLPGVEEAIRQYGLQRTPYAMLSRGVAGLHNATLLLGLPGSTNGARESMEALFPFILHGFRILTGRKHHLSNK